MARPENAMEIFRLLNKSNCRECGEKTCLAFAGAVFQGRRAIGECPHLSPRVIERFADARSLADARSDDSFDEPRNQVAALDFQQAATRIGGRVQGNRLTLKILGKDFSIDDKGDFHTDIHMLPWVIGPFLGYVLDCRGREVSGEWLSFRELRGGAERYPLFRKRIEEAMRQIADRYPDLFSDMAHLFRGRQIDSPFDSDVSVILPVLPLVPIMICYWQADEGMDSDLLIFFDRSADDNIGIDNAYTLAAGLTQMFEKLALRHGVPIDHPHLN
ncbi:DUF3786 domain-containing protein [Desulfofustis glycolicus]|uniref:Putative Fe-S cluster n=1 Tax=Desulfofustis glycolicus DSM 9705 TaxID=1121409 RepID=A0A1M5TSH3_9BACT|nr:DUF3786 domain-containing protein [Desulfofustis glycolicus]SHH53727.1 Putative Fe-S cluster [Desulfofustis glycolicus DSM 9705]